MKKVVSLVLVAIMLAALLAGCTTLVGDDKGAIIDMYITTEVYNFDPQVSITDTAMLKVFSLCYEGLTRLDKNGKWQNALMKSYVIDKDTDEEFSILIYLKNSYWTDGRTVQAPDFAYSWKRLLDANIKNEAASLLYDLKNAMAIKLGDASIDDLGVAAVDTYTLKVTFEKKVDLDKFFENCSSVALSPLREDVISRYGDELWAKKGTYIITNGPFTPKSIDYPNLLRLERSPYYYLDRNKNENLDKYVIPYRLLTDYFRGNLNTQLDAFNEGSIFYLGEIPLDKRAELKILGTFEVFGEKPAESEGEGGGFVIKGDGALGKAGGSIVYHEEGDAGVFCDRTFIEAAISGDGSKVRSPYRDAFKSLAFTMACNESMATGKPVKVELE